MTKPTAWKTTPNQPKPEHRKSEIEEKEEREENLDKTIEDSFPASDPPSSIPDPEDEDSAAEIGWPTYGQDRGFTRGENVVTVHSVVAITSPIRTSARTAAPRTASPKLATST